MSVKRERESKFDLVFTRSEMKTLKTALDFLTQVNVQNRTHATKLGVMTVTLADRINQLVKSGKPTTKDVQVEHEIRAEIDAIFKENDRNSVTPESGIVLTNRMVN